MKKAIQLLILLLLPVAGFSKCTSSGLTFWPSAKTIYENSIFVIDGYATSQKIIEGLGLTYKVYLKSGGQKINLKVQETNTGQFRLTQAILKPETNLTPGLEYELVIENLKDLATQVSRYNVTTNKYEKVKWKVIAGNDSIAPSWVIKPSFKNNIYTMFGCGPEIFSNFNFSASDNSSLLVRTTVKNISTGKETSYYLDTKDNTIAIGHGMCAGAFDFDDGEKYEVEFSLFDSSGNITPWTGERIKFNKPTKI